MHSLHSDEHQQKQQSATDQVKWGPRWNQIWKTLQKWRRARWGKRLQAVPLLPAPLGEWHLPSLLLSALWQLHYITISYLRSARCLSRWILWCSLPSHQLETVCLYFPFRTLFACPSRFFSTTYNTFEQQLKGEMERLRGSNHGCTVRQRSRDICGWVKPPCWSYRHAQSSTWLNMNCGPPTASSLTYYLMSLSTRI